MEANITTLTNERFLDLIEAEKDLNALYDGRSIVEDGKIKCGGLERFYTTYESNGVKRYSHVTTGSLEVIRVIEESTLTARQVGCENAKLKNQVEKLEKEKTELTARYDGLKGAYKQLQGDYVFIKHGKRKWYQFWK